MRSKQRQAAVAAVSPGRAWAEELEPRLFLTAVQAAVSDAFVDSVGVCTHWNYLDTAYGSQFSLLKQKLDDLDIRWLRDGVHPENATALAHYLEIYNDLGIKTTDSVQDKTGGILDPTKIAARLNLLDDYANMLIAIEGPNEYDTSSDPDKWNTLRNYVQQLYTQVQANPALAPLPVLAPSMAQPAGYGYLGDVSAYVDKGNIHPYPGTNTPTYGLDTWMTNARTCAGDVGIWATETGYHNATSGISETAEAKYLPRLLMYYFGRGVERTATYELIDLQPDPNKTNSQYNYGLLRNDGSEKPVFQAVENLIDLVKDPGGSYAPGVLDYGIAGTNTNSISSKLLQKRDGTYQLFLWQEVSSWDSTTHTDIANADRQITLSLNDQSFSQIRIYRVNDSTTPIQTINNPGSTISLSVPDELLLVELVGGQPITSMDRVIAEYQFDNSSNRLGSTDTDSLSTASDITFGSRLSNADSRLYTSNAKSKDSMGLRGNWVLDSLSNAISLGSNLQFGFTANAGETVNLQALKFWTEAAPGHQVSYALRSSVDNYAANIGSTVTLTADSLFTEVSFSLSGAAFQGLSTAQFRLYVWENTSDSNDLSRIDSMRLVAAGATPAAPSNLSAVATGTGSITASWTDNATDETSLVLERSTASDFSGATAFTLPANTTSYADSGLAANTTYYYRVKAVNAAGSSAWSSAASATTQPASTGDALAFYSFDNSSARYISSDSDANSTALDLVWGSRFTASDAKTFTTGQTGDAVGLRGNYVVENYSTASSTNSYAQVTVNPASGSDLDLSSLTFYGKAPTSTSAANFKVRTNVSGTWADVGSTLTTSGTGYQLFTVDLSGAGFQNLAGATFRIYVWESVGTTASNLTCLDGISLNGLAVSPVVNLAVYDFENTSNRYLSADADGNSTASDLSFGSRFSASDAKTITTGQSGSALGLRGNYVVENWSTANSTGSYVQMTLTAGTGKLLDLSSLSFYGKAPTSSSSGNFQVQSNATGSWANVGSVQTTSGTGYELFTLDLSGSNFQNLSSVSFRIYVWESAGTTSSNLTCLDGIVVQGTAA